MGSTRRMIGVSKETHRRAKALIKEYESFGVTLTMEQAILKLGEQSRTDPSTLPGWRL